MILHCVAPDGIAALITLAFAALPRRDPVFYAVGVNLVPIQRLPQAFVALRVVLAGKAILGVRHKIFVELRRGETTERQKNRAAGQPGRRDGSDRGYCERYRAPRSHGRAVYSGEGRKQQNFY